MQIVFRPPVPAPAQVDWKERGTLRHLWVLSASSNLPTHVTQRQAKRALQRLRAAGLSAHEVTVVDDAPSPGIGSCVVIAGMYENGWGGGSALGKRGKPAERVADEAVDAFLRFHQSTGAVDVHLADQLIVPLAVRVQRWAFTTPHMSNHLRTVIWLTSQFIPVQISHHEEEGRVIIQCSNSSF